LKSKLKKDKFLSKDPSIRAAISKLFPLNVTLTSEGMANKLESRLLSSRTLSGAVNGVISSLCSTLKPTEDHGIDIKSEDNDQPTATRATSPEADTDDEPDDSAETEEDTRSEDDSTTGGEPLSPRASSPSRSDSSSDRASHIPHVGGVSKIPGANSVFLPTLSNGFIPGGSDTDWSDGETEAGGGVRKNRRGQRARRAIWEKKYGKRAKHLQKQEDSGATHPQRGLRKHVQGSQAVTHSRPTSHARQYGRANEGEVPNNQIPHKQKAKHVDDLELHPSWIAKRRMKEKSSAAIIPSQGKRIKFED